MRRFSKTHDATENKDITQAPRDLFPQVQPNRLRDTQIQKSSASADACSQHTCISVWFVFSRTPGSSSQVEWLLNASGTGPKSHPRPRGRKESDQNSTGAALPPACPLGSPAQKTHPEQTLSQYQVRFFILAFLKNISSDVSTVNL